MRTCFGAALAALLIGSTTALADSVRLKISDAQATFDPASGRPVLNVTLASESARAHARFTAARVGEVIRVRVDGEILASPTVREPVLGRSLQLSGLESVEKAQELAVRIRAGEARVEVEGSDR